MWNTHLHQHVYSSHGVEIREVKSCIDHCDATGNLQEITFGLKTNVLAILNTLPSFISLSQ